MPSTSNEIERQDSALFRRFLRQCREYGPVRRPVNGLPAPFASLPCCPFRLRLTVWLIPRAFSFASSGNSERRRSEEHTSELQSLMRISYAVFCLKKKNIRYKNKHELMITY